jgi:hypothetical protein
VAAFTAPAHDSALLLTVHLVRGRVPNPGPPVRCRMDFEGNKGIATMPRTITFGR